MHNSVKNKHEGMMINSCEEDVREFSTLWKKYKCNGLNNGDNEHKNAKDRSGE